MTPGCDICAAASMRLKGCLVEHWWIFHSNKGAVNQLIVSFAQPATEVQCNGWLLLGDLEIRKRNIDCQKKKKKSAFHTLVVSSSQMRQTIGADSWGTWYCSNDTTKPSCGVRMELFRMMMGVLERLMTYSNSMCQSWMIAPLWPSLLTEFNKKKRKNSKKKNKKT